MSAEYVFQRFRRPIMFHHILVLFAIIAHTHIQVSHNSVWSQVSPRSFLKHSDSSNQT